MAKQSLLLTNECPSCGAWKMKGQYLCRDCWEKLPAVSRMALSVEDDDATWRYRRLLRYLEAGVPLANICVR